MRSPLLAAAPLRSLLACEVDGEIERVVIRTAGTYSLPVGASTLSPETPLAQALSKVTVGGSTEYKGPSGQMVRMKLISAEPLQDRGSNTVNRPE